MTVVARAAAASIARTAASSPSDSLHSAVRLHGYQTLTAASHKIFVTQAPEWTVEKKRHRQQNYFIGSIIIPNHILTAA